MQIIRNNKQADMLLILSRSSKNYASNEWKIKEQFGRTSVSTVLNQSVNDAKIKVKTAFICQIDGVRCRGHFHAQRRSKSCKMIALLIKTQFRMDKMKQTSKSNGPNLMRQSYSSRCSLILWSLANILFVGPCDSVASRAHKINQYFMSF